MTKTTAMTKTVTMIETMRMMRMKSTTMTTT